jgi:biopolymer transport protein ExbD
VTTDQPGGAPPQQFKPAAPQKQAGMVVYKRELRKAIAKNAQEVEINFLNITAMMDMMTIILVFLLKSLSSSPAQLPQSDDLLIPKSVLTTSPEAESEGLPVIVSKSQVIVNDNVVCPIPPDAPQYGIATAYKRGNRNEYFIVPLGNALQAWRDTDKRIRQMTGKDANHSDAIIIADVTTPFRVLSEVMYTLGQTEFGKFHLLVLQGGGTKK